MKIFISILYICLVLILSNVVGAQDHNHEEHDHEHQELLQLENIRPDDRYDHDDQEVHLEHEAHDEHSRENGTTLTMEQMQLANVRVAELQANIMSDSVYAPGEIKANGYTSYVVSPRVDSIVLRRHVALGDHVEQGQNLVTLFSETVADAQANFQITSAEWQRVEKLGRTSVGDNRFITAQAAFNASRARLIAFGLSEEVIANDAQTIGEYTLVAAIEGVVRSDDFHQGQRVNSGQLLMDLVDEHELWVDARLPPAEQFDLQLGSPATVTVGKFKFNATVAQEAHTIDPETRTRIVRLSIHNEEHRLHPGLFVDVAFLFSTEHAVLAVSEQALMRSANGDWIVFVEGEPGEFLPVEVSLGRSFGDWREIAGIEVGTRIAVEGAFFIASEIAKGGFDPHNH